jgi:hypothetical protein
MALRVVELNDDGVSVRNPGALSPGRPWPTERLAVLGEALWLTDYELTFGGDALTVSTSWFTARELPGDYQVWLQVRDGEGNVIAERRDYALAGMSPPRLWRPVDLVEDRAQIQLPPRASDVVTVWATLVSTADGTLLPVTETAGIEAERDWLRLSNPAE